MRKTTIDLHCHSYWSDGKNSPEELLRIAKDKQLNLFSITDHDTILGTVEAGDIVSKYSFKYVHGIELSTGYENQKVEILGYKFDPWNKELIEAMEFLQKERKLRFEKILEKLNNIKVKIKKDEIMVHVGKTKSLGRPHVARAIIAKGYVKTMQDAFVKYLGKGKPAYIPRKTIALDEGIKIIQKSGGIVVIPHPLLIESNDLLRLGKLIDYFVELGAKGIEVFYDYSRIVPEIPSKILNLGISLLKKKCEEYDLLQTGGSDFHGGGNSIGSVKIPEREKERLIDYFS